MKGFADIIGNEQIKEHFGHAIRSERIPHCYILSGEDGIGRRTLADAFAAALQCEAPVDERPCGECPSCIRFMSGNHPDVVYPKHEKPTVFGVDDVRDGINKDIQIRPYASRYKIYIVEDAEKMSAAAQNALLKTIEEPPSYGIIMLITTNAQSMLETIRSRSLVLNVRPVGKESFTKALLDAGVEEDRIDEVWRFAQGNIGKGLRLAASEEFTAMTDLIMKLLSSADLMTFSEVLDCIAKLEAYKVSLKDCFDYMKLWYRDVLMYKATKDPNLLVFPGSITSIERIARSYSYNQINYILDAIDKASARLDANVSYQLVMELLWMAIRNR